MDRRLRLLMSTTGIMLLAVAGVMTQARHTPAASSYIDVHTHIEGEVADKSTAAAAAVMQRDNRARYLFLPSPFDEGDPRAFDIELLRKVSQKYGTRMAVLGGGGTLNPMIVEAVRIGRTTPELEKRFKDRAEAIAGQGAPGFGELTAEHRPSASTPSYQSAPPDHPLFMALTDIAASRNMPIVLHMEAVDRDMPLPASWRVNSANVPSVLKGNIEGFERLVSHNPRARLVWAHGGWDNTGVRTPQLMRRLFRAHPNLYSEIKIDPLNPGLNSPLEGGATGNLKAEWLRLFQDFPDRFVIGSDQHYPMPENQPQRWQAAVSMFNQLPADLRQRIGIDNVARIYRLN